MIRTCAAVSAYESLGSSELRTSGLLDVRAVVRDAGTLEVLATNCGLSQYHIKSVRETTQPQIKTDGCRWVCSPSGVDMKSEGLEQKDEFENFAMCFFHETDDENGRERNI